MRARKEITAERVSGEFTSHVELVRPRYDIHFVAEDIRNAGVVYEDVEKARVAGIETFLRRMKIMELGVVMPPLLWLYTKEVPEERRRRSVRALESYVVRRMLCVLHSQGLNRLFVELLPNLENGEIESTDQTIIHYLKRQTVDNRVWPTDSMLMTSLVKTPLRGTVSRQVMVLEAIEMHMRGDKTEELGQSSLTREHITPQSWERNWPLSASGLNQQEAREFRNQTVRELGNFTLTTNKLNSSLSNGSWNEKRDTLEQYTALRLNWELLNRAPDVWDEATIHDRSEHLARIIAKIWRSADDLEAAS